MTKAPTPKRRPSKPHSKAPARHRRMALLVLAASIVFVAGLLLDPVALASLAWAVLSGELGRIVQLAALVLLACAGAILVASRRRPAPRRKPRAAAARAEAGNEAPG